MITIGLAMNFDHVKQTILLTISGSRSYGLHTDKSDVDVKGVIIAPKDYYIGIKSFEQIDGADSIQKYKPFLNEEEQKVSENTKLEGTAYDIKKFINLASACNPNILDALFCREEEVRLCSNAGRILRDNRDLFLSAKARFTFSGYAHSQLSRMKQHKSYLDKKGLINKPERSDFDLPDASTISKDNQGYYLDAINKKLQTWIPNFDIVDDQAAKISLTNDFEKMLLEVGIAADERFFAAGHSVGIPDSIMKILHDERRYQNAMADWNRYQSWKQNRNKERAAMEEQYGYDLKFAVHLIRLQTTVLELLKTGVLNVYRPDREFLLFVRNGGLSYEELIALSEKLEAESNEIYTQKKYVIPKSPDAEKINKLCTSLIEEHLEISYSYI